MVPQGRSRLSEIRSELSPATLAKAWANVTRGGAYDHGSGRREGAAAETPVQMSLTLRAPASLSATPMKGFMDELDDAQTADHPPWRTPAVSTAQLAHDELVACMAAEARIATLDDELRRTRQVASEELQTQAARSHRLQAERVALAAELARAERSAAQASQAEAAASSELHAAHAAAEAAEWRTAQLEEQLQAGGRALRLAESEARALAQELEGSVQAHTHARARARARTHAHTHTHTHNTYTRTHTLGVWCPG